MDFSQLAQGIQPETDADQPVSVDISRWYGEGAVLQLAPPDVGIIWKGGEQSKQIEVNHPRWPTTLCQYLGILVAAHVSPMPNAATEDDQYKALRVWYGDMARRKPTCFDHISSAFNKAFPDFSDFDAAEAAAEKNSGR